MIRARSRRSLDSSDAAAAESLVSAPARALAALLVACLAVLVAGAAPAGAQEADPPPGRVLLISVPGLTWPEVRDHDLPAIEGLLDESALADMAPRGVSPRATPGAAYLTISAGSRATSDPLVDGQQLALGEQAAGSSAGDVFQRRTGVEPDGRYVALAWPTLERVNAAQPYDAELGLLTDTLDGAGLGVEAIGNADGTDTVGTSYERQVGLAAATGDGVIPAGELDADLLTRDPSRPFGQRLDLDQVIQRFERAWGAPAGRDGGLVVVEASDLARSMRYRDRVDLARYEELRSQALQDTDNLVARLLEHVDPERDTVLLVAPYNLPNDRNLTVAALRAPGQEPGYLRSASTQRAGFVTLVDVAPTVLDQLGVARPVDMEGRPAEVVASGASLETRVDRLVTLNEASRFRERLLFPTTLAVVVVLAVLCAATVVVLVRGGPPRARRVLAFVALADLAVLPMSYVARAFPLEDLGAGFYWAFVVAGGVAVAGLATLAGRHPRRERLALVAVLAAGAGRAAGGRHDRLAPEPERRLRLLADGQLPAVRDQQLRLRPGGGVVVPAGRVRGRPLAVAPGPGRGGGPAGRRAGRHRHAGLGLGRGRDHRLHPHHPGVRRPGHRLPPAGADPARRPGGDRGLGDRLRPDRPGPPRGPAGPPGPPVRAGRGRGPGAAAVHHGAQAAGQPAGDDDVVLDRGHPGGDRVPGVPGPLPGPPPGPGARPDPHPAGRRHRRPSWPACWAAWSTTRAPSSAASPSRWWRSPSPGWPWRPPAPPHPPSPPRPRPRRPAPHLPSPPPSPPRPRPSRLPPSPSPASAAVEPHPAEPEPSPDGAPVRAGTERT